jgi:hypothetical protein
MHRQEPTTLGDIFQEIDEEIRRDRWDVLWKRYGVYLIAVAVVIVGATAAWAGWKEYEKRQNVAVTSAIHTAMAAARAGQRPEAIEAFAAAATDANDRQVALALLQEAALRANEKDVESARGLYQTVRENESLAAPYSALATIRGVELDLDTGDAATMLGWLSPLMADDNVWRHIAWELAAALELRAGNSSGAKALLEKLRDDLETPTAAGARAEAYLAQF